MRYVIDTETKKAPTKVSLEMDKSDNDVIDVHVDGIAILGIRQDGHVVRYSYVGTSLGLVLEDEGEKVQILDEDELDD